MDLEPTIARLKTQLTALRSVGGAADLDAALTGVVATPAAFVMPVQDAAVDLGMLGSTGQRIAQGFAVLHCVANRRDAQGSAALNDLQACRVALRTALVGWVPDASTGEAVVFTGGRLLRLDGDGRLWWADEFQLVTYYWS